MKKILFIALPYHQYTEEIVKELRKQNYHVDYFPIKPRKLWHKILQTISKKNFQRYLDHFHKKNIKLFSNNKYSIVLFIQVHFMSPRNIEYLKQTQSNSKFILYNWDSIKTHDFRPFIKYFDKIATFDVNDAASLNLDYLPLFSIKKFQDLDKSKEKLQVYFVGNIVSVERYFAIRKFKEYCHNNNINFSCYMKCTPVTYGKLLLKGKFPLDVHFTSIHPKKFISMMKESSAVFDFANHQQSGYTMRFIENLCAGKKIITNNHSVFSETFFSEDRIFVFDMHNYEGIKQFLDQPLIKTDEKFEKYYLKNFLNQLLNQ
jgi:hypothetical protein